MEAGAQTIVPRLDRAPMPAIRDGDAADCDSEKPWITRQAKLGGCTGSGHNAHLSRRSVHGKHVAHPALWREATESVGCAAGTAVMVAGVGDGAPHVVKICGDLECSTQMWRCRMIDRHPAQPGDGGPPSDSATMPIRSRLSGDAERSHRAGWRLTDARSADWQPAAGVQPKVATPATTPCNWCGHARGAGTPAPRHRATGRSASRGKAARAAGAHRTPRCGPPRARSRRARARW
jgi:hypothetical protein